MPFRSHLVNVNRILLSINLLNCEIHLVQFECIFHLHGLTQIYIGRETDSSAHTHLICNVGKIHTSLNMKREKAKCRSRNETAVVLQSMSQPHTIYFCTKTVAHTFRSSLLISQIYVYM